MKKYFFSAAVAMMTLFATSCSQDETFAPENQVPATASFRVNLPIDGMTTRGADASVKRYAIAIEGLDITNDDTDNPGAFLIQDNGTFEIPGLVTGQQYTVYFWADYGDGTYDVTWPNWVSLNDGKEIGMAYCGHTTITLGEQADPYDITLRRAVAQVTLAQKNAARVNDGLWLRVHYNRYTVYNAKDNTCAGDAAAAKIEYHTDAAWSANQQIAQFYVFAPEAGYTSDFVVKNGDDNPDADYTAPVIATVSNVPLKANYKTNITGNFNTSTFAAARFTVTTDDTWGTSDNSETF